MSKILLMLRGLWASFLSLLSCFKMPSFSFGGWPGWLWDKLVIGAKRLMASALAVWGNPLTYPIIAVACFLAFSFGHHAGAKLVSDARAKADQISRHLSESRQEIVALQSRLDTAEKRASAAEAKLVAPSAAPTAVPTAKTEPRKPARRPRPASPKPAGWSLW